MSKETMLTTFDNPYDPFEEFTLWLMFDKEKGYDTCERMMRFANITEDMTQKEIDEEVERAMDKLIELDFTNTFKKVTRQVSEELTED